jgi:hypothetical protein
MKWIALIILAPTLIYAQRSSPVLKCLGSEERDYHLKKVSGPRMDLNQKLIAEIIQIPQVSIKPEFIESICHSKYSPSLRLLELSLISEEKLFYTDGKTDLVNSINQSMISDYIESSREIFIQFIHQVQAIAPTSNCLEDEIPELKEIFTNLKHAQEEIGVKKILNGKINSIFMKLIRFENILKNCQSRLKKTKRSGSTSSRK